MRTPNQINLIAELIFPVLSLLEDHSRATDLKVLWIYPFIDERPASSAPAY